MIDPASYRDARNRFISSKQDIEHQMHLLDSQHVSLHLGQALQQINELSESLTTIQQALNVSWKRVQQLSEEIANLQSRIKKPQAL